MAHVDRYAALWSQHEDIGPGEVAVYAALTMYANGSGICWPSLSTLAKYSHVSRRSVIRAVQRLCAAGIVTTRRTQNSVVYHLPIEDDATALQRRSAQSNQCHGGTSATQSPVEAEPVPHSHQCHTVTSATQSPGGATVALASLTPPRTPREICPSFSDGFALQLPSSTPKAKRSTPPDTTLVADFETWWKQYPIKEDKRKVQALYAWQRKQGHSAEAMLTALRHYLELCEQTGRYHKNPATFLSKQSSYIADYQTPPEPPRPRERQTDYYDDGMDIHV